MGEFLRGGEAGVALVASPRRTRAKSAWSAEPMCSCTVAIELQSALSSLCRTRIPDGNIVLLCCKPGCRCANGEVRRETVAIVREDKVLCGLDVVALGIRGGDPTPSGREKGPRDQAQLGSESLLTIICVVFFFGR